MLLCVFEFSGFFVFFVVVFIRTHNLGPTAALAQVLYVHTQAPWALILLFCAFFENDRAREREREKSFVLLVEILCFAQYIPDFYISLWFVLFCVRRNKKKTTIV